MPPGWWVLDDHEMWQVAAYVRSLGHVAPENVPGDAQAGSRLFRTAGCLGCHQIALEGGRVGPSLTDIGSRRGAAHLREALLNPTASLPEEFLQVQAVTRDGKRITGIRLNEDTYSIQVLDVNEDLHSLAKKDLQTLTVDKKKSRMPAYTGVFTAAELDDLVAYLYSLQRNARSLP